MWDIVQVIASGAILALATIGGAFILSCSLMIAHAWARAAVGLPMRPDTQAAPPLKPPEPELPVVVVMPPSRRHLEL